MDQIKIGKFIAEMRKEQNLTQIDLAEKLGVSNKTISKWECGNSMPDYVLMENLCELLKINVNELLSGERLLSKDYDKNAEQNIVDLIQENDTKIKWARKDIFEVILGIAALFGTVVLMILLWGGMASIGYFIDVPSLFLILLLSFIMLIISDMWKDFWKAFHVVWKRVKITNVVQVKKSILAIKTEMYALVMSGFINSAVAFVILLRYRCEPEEIGPYMTLTVLSALYGVFLSACLLPIKTRLEKKLLEE